MMILDSGLIFRATQAHAVCDEMSRDAGICDPITDGDAHQLRNVTSRFDDAIELSQDMSQKIRKPSDYIELRNIR